MEKVVIFILVVFLVLVAGCGEKETKIPETTTEATTSIPKECDKPCPTNYICDPDGVCRYHRPRGHGIATCVERGDNTVEYYRKGNVTDTQQDLLEGEFWEDRCEGNTLIEYICDRRSDDVVVIEHRCAIGCEDGACKAIAD